MSRVIVVGGGIVGASTAFHLQRAGHDALLLDAGSQGAATDAGAGIIAAISPRQRPDEELAFTFAAVGYHHELGRELEELGYGEHGYARAGELIVATDDAEASRLAALAEQAQALVAAHGSIGTGAPELVGAGTTRRLCPILGQVTGALWLPEVARLDGRQLRDRLLGLFRRFGGEVVREPAALRVHGGHVVGVSTPGRTLAADAVVLAAGAWAGRLAADAGLRLPVYPQRGQIVHASLPGLPDLPIVSGFHTHYLLSFPGGHMVFGATREDDAGFDYALTVGGIAEIVREAIRVAPAIANAQWIEARIGFRPCMPDGAPAIGTPRELPGLVVGTGFGPRGLTLGPYAGAVLARLAVGQSVDVPPAFDVNRFTR